MSPSLVPTIGWSPRVFNFKQKQTRATLPPTEWSIALLPVGGFVKMLGADPMEDVPAEIRDVALNFKPVWRRFLIALAGPLFNLILPFIIFFFVELFLFIFIFVVEIIVLVIIEFIVVDVFQVIEANVFFIIVQ